MHQSACRASGGVAVYLKSSIACKFCVWKVSLPGSIVWLRSKGKLSHAGVEHRLYIGVVYIPPRGATIEHYSSSLPAYDILQQNIAEVCAAGGVMILAGDFNARTASAQDLTHQDEFADLLDFLLLPAPPPSSFPTRQSFDKTSCPFGRRLLETCETSDLVIHNGRVPGDEAGLFTCPQITGPGGRVVDYFLATSTSMTSILSLIITEEPGLSDHCSLRPGMTLQAQNCKTPAQPLRLEKQAPEVKVQKITFKADRVDAYRKKLSDLFAPSSLLQMLLALAAALRYRIALLRLPLLALVSPVRTLHVNRTSHGMIWNASMQGLH